MGFVLSVRVSVGKEGDLFSEDLGNPKSSYDLGRDPTLGLGDHYSLPGSRRHGPLSSVPLVEFIFETRCLLLVLR